MLLLNNAATAQSSACAQPAAEFIAVQGSVDLRRGAAADWLPALVGHQICLGDAVRTSTEGQALVRLADGTLLNLNSGTQGTFGEPEAGASGTIVELIRGIIHIISRDPRSLRFNTPYVNAGLEGTEFTIAVTDEATEVTVVEGEVSLDNALGEIRAPQGTRGIARAAAAPEVFALDTATAALAWTAYFPDIVPNGPAAAKGDRSVSENDSAALAARAAARLRVGLPEMAAADLTRSIELDGSNATAWSLRALIALADNERETAKNYVSEALLQAPESTAAHLALSYIEQRFGTLEAALTAAMDAAVDDPSAALVWERRAELLAATGDWASARGAAMQALQADDSRARTYAILGFIDLDERRNDRAIEHFLDAVERDAALPLARLGLGLAYTQIGDVEAGREQIEISVSLDGRDSQIRSYMAKSYATEHRDQLGSTLLRIAKELDPSDPTPWLYSSRGLQQANESVAALWDYERGSERASRQPLFRSTFALDEDTAIRGAGLGNLYRSLRFDRLAALEGFAALDAQPTDYAAHQLLADVDSLQPRLQMARVNEQFKAQLLRPVNVLPTHPHFGEANLFLVDLFGPSDLAATDLLDPLSRDKPRVQVSATGGSNGTRGSEFLIAHTQNRVSVSAGALDFETDGFSPNNDFSQRVANALVQYQLSGKTSLLFEGRALDIEHGNIERYFDPNAFQPLQRADLRVDSLRAGFRRTISPRNTLIGFLSNYSAQDDNKAGEIFFGELDVRSNGAELQHLHSGARLAVTSGLIYSERDLSQRLTIAIPGAPPIPPSTTRSMEAHAALYTVAVYDVNAHLKLTGGIEAVHFDSADGTADSVNPKVGLEWQIAPRTQLRFATFDNQQGPIIGQFVVEPTLSPTYIAGFNQQYFASTSEESRQSGVAVDHQTSERFFVGGEWVTRDVSRPYTDSYASPPTSRQFDVDERMARAYLYWTASANMALATEFQYERFHNNGTAYFDNYSTISTRRLPVTLSFFHRPRFSTRVRGTYVDQSGNFLDTTAPQARVLVADSDEFWVFDLEANYRLPKRRGSISLIAANVLDAQFRYQDTDPRNPRIMPERMLSLRFTVAL